jgi:hypothetical protein
MYPGFHRLEWSFREHITRALPTETIFYLLRKIPSESLTRGYFADLMLEIIFKWLQVSVNECNQQTRHTKNPTFVSRDLVPSDRATCTIDSG